MSKKEIMASQRAYVFMYEYCTINVKNGTVFACHSDSTIENIPIENTMFIMLGSGTSITQNAVKELSQANVPFCFVGSKNGAFHAGNIIPIEPTKQKVSMAYAKSFMSKILDDNTQIELSKQLLFEQFKNIQYIWNDEEAFADYALYYDEDLHMIKKSIFAKNKITELLSYEGVKKKEINTLIANTFNVKFTRIKENPKDKINQFINVGNSIMYGYAQTVLWWLGIPPQFSLLHGETNRGALIYDAADLWKTAIITPLAFVANYKDLSLKDFTSNVNELCSNDKYKIMKKMFKFMKGLCE